MENDIVLLLATNNLTIHRKTAFFHFVEQKKLEKYEILQNGVKYFLFVERVPQIGKDTTETNFFTILLTENDIKSKFQPTKCIPSRDKTYVLNCNLLSG